MTQVRKLSLVDLSREATQLINQLEAAERKNPVWNRLLSMRRRTFLTIREIYEDPAGFPFIDSNRLGGFSQLTEQEHITLEQANCASGLDMIEGLQSGDDQDVLGRLRELDAFCHNLFTAEDIDLALDLRTVRLVEELLAEKPKAKLGPIAASVFCAPVQTSGKTDYVDMLVRGDRRPLVGVDGPDVHDKCLERITKVVDIGKKDKKSNGWKLLQEEYPRDDLLGKLREWFIARHELSHGHALQLRSADHDVSHDVSEQLRQEESQSQAGSQVNRFSGPQM